MNFKNLYVLHDSDLIRKRGSIHQKNNQDKKNDHIRIIFQSLKTTSEYFKNTLCNLLYYSQSQLRLKTLFKKVPSINNPNGNIG